VLYPERCSRQHAFRSSQTDTWVSKLALRQRRPTLRNQIFPADIGYIGLGVLFMTLSKAHTIHIVDKR
jgi:hypothetical protein